MTRVYPSGAHAPDGSDNVDRLTDADMDLMPGGSAENRSGRISTRARAQPVAAEIAPAKAT
jgi:hypothetical protein